MANSTDARIAIEDARAAIAAATSKGITTFTPTNVLELLAEIQKATDDDVARPDDQRAALLEQYKARLMVWANQVKQVDDWRVENVRTLIALGQSALKSAILINGGAAVALLAFLGHLVTQERPDVSLIPFATSLRLFVIGVLCASIACGTTYLSQYAYSNPKTWAQRLGLIIQVVTIALVLCAYVAFLAGADAAYIGFV
jgi:hypothetical protein